MGSVLAGRQPEKMLYYFEEISAIPRSSGKEKQICEYLAAFAKKRGLVCRTDSAYNTVIKKAASPGYENHPPVMLQGHVDMVCEKNADTIHDFDTQGIVLCLKGEQLHAKGTTLGADNGAAVAMMLAVLDDNNLAHPPLECVFTTGEEIGLLGAAAMDTSDLKARTMINLDSEDEGIATVSCAGGMRLGMEKLFSREEKQVYALALRVRGLQGGHSGMAIGDERVNALKAMGRLVREGMDTQGFHLIHISGGNKDNAIPRECDALLGYETDAQREMAGKAIRAIAQEIKKECKISEPEFYVEIEEIDYADYQPLEAGAAKEIVALLCLAPHGVLCRDMQAGGFVVASVNLAAIQIQENRAAVVFSPRSSVDSLQNNTRRNLEMLAQRLGFTCQCDSEYPGWSYNPYSPVREIFYESYRELFGEALKIEHIHAGLECGLFVDKMPGLDAIAVGPTVRDCHTPQESMDLPSCEKMWKLLCEVLKRL